MALVEFGALERLAHGALRLAGVPEPHGRIQAGVLLDAELRGVSSHGLLRLERIIRRIANGVIDPHATGTHDWRSPAFLAVDGGKGLGPVVASAALDALKSRVEETGIAIAAISNSNHIGMLGWYAERLATEGYTIIGLTTSEALVHPWGAQRAMIGTNPIAIGIPTGSGPFLMDTATSIASMGDVHDHAHRKAPLPAGWALDANGQPTTDPEAAKGGALAPFGQAKGYALGLALELLVGSLTGAALGRDVRGTLDDTAICNKGDVFIVIKGVQRNLETYLAAIRAMEPAPGFDQVLIPGERGRACRELRLRDGVPIATAVWRTLQRLAGTTGS
jgi:LDH2 family malate/lactate/ureidoglycolate dehydrogenase